ncbi:uncharacterized protein [Hetaerina americana]|uniref:uncharacterized protein n=1 Tax=Hetaerina americana TaxID=62018 RepID=UPI003A7F3C8D
MERSSEDEGESSSTDQAAFKDDENERPLKKARYIWQIKGKYHLREKERKIYLPSETRSESIAVPVEFKNLSAVCCGNEENYIGERTMESLPDETSPVDKCSTKCPSPLQDIEEVIKEDATTFEVPNKDESAEVKRTTPPLHLIIEREPSHASPKTSSCCFQSFLHSVNRSSLHVRKWQTKQLAQGIVDNTINKVLEEMGFVPLPEDADDVFNEPTNCNDSHQNFENEAVLMAIQSHGLQRNEFDPPNTPGNESAKESETDDGSKNPGLKAIPNNLEHIKDTTTHSAPRACNIPQVISDVKVFEPCDPFRQRQSVDGFQPKFNLTKTKFNLNDSSEGEKWLEEMAQEMESSVIPLGFNSDRYGLVSGSSSEDNTDSVDSFVKLDYDEDDEEKLVVIGFEENRPCGNAIKDTETQPSLSVEKPLPLVEHDDFLDQAVAVAIQKKGLSVFGCIDNG